MATRKSPPPLDFDQLFIASTTLADTLPYEQATLARVARAARVPVAQLRQQFGDFGRLLVALQQRFLDELRDAVIAQTSVRPSGFERLHQAALIYLRHCLRYRGLRGWMLQARLADPAMAEGLRRQNQAFTLVISTELSALGQPHPLPAARLFLAAVQEAGRLEHHHGAPLPHIREALAGIARFYTRPAAKTSPKKS